MQCSTLRCEPLNLAPTLNQIESRHSRMAKRQMGTNLLPLPHLVVRQHPICLECQIDDDMVIVLIHHQHPHAHTYQLVFSLFIYFFRQSLATRPLVAMYCWRRVVCYHAIYSEAMQGKALQVPFKSKCLSKMCVVSAKLSLGTYIVLHLNNHVNQAN